MATMSCICKPSPQGQECTGIEWEGDYQGRTDQCWFCSFQLDIYDDCPARTDFS